MSANEDFFRARATQARSEAEVADLANVRDRHLRAAIAWEEMADRARRTDRLRTEQEARKADAAAMAQ